MIKSVYITGVSKFLPNRPVSNDEMERYLGMINGKPSAARRIVLGRNKIECRYYALDEAGQSTHTNAEMTALAVKNLLTDDRAESTIQLLSCGTTSPDQLLPSHAAMVHGLLGNTALELASFSGACCSGMQALKYAWLSILSGNTSNAVCTGSERLSSWLKSGKYDKEADNLKKLQDDCMVAFEKEFLRWMLSDGAGAAWLQDTTAEGLNLKVEWIEITSFANEFETCMYAGAVKTEGGGLKGWHEYEPDEWLDKSIFALHQDVKLLGKNIVKFGLVFLEDIIARRGFDIREINWFLPHLSSAYFYKPIMESLQKAGLDVPEQKWFTNLTRVGNVGAASSFLMLEELFRSGRLRKGEKILLMVPESARFSYSYCLLTVC